MHYSSNATRWEKAVVGANSIVAEVTKFDPDGVDIVMVGGGVAATTTTTLFEEEEETEESATADEEDEACVEWHRNVQTAEGLEELVTEKEPKGSCPLGKAMDEVLTEALSKCSNRGRFGRIGYGEGTERVVPARESNGRSFDGSLIEMFKPRKVWKNWLRRRNRKGRARSGK